MGKQYIIEIDEEPYVSGINNSGPNRLYHVKGFNSLVFDETRLNKLKELKPLDRIEKIKEQAKKEGIEEAWNLVKKILSSPSTKESMSAEECEEAFGTFDIDELLSYSYEQIFQKYKKWERLRESKKESNDIEDKIEKIKERLYYLEKRISSLEILSGF